jgi:hypothetical protein
MEDLSRYYNHRGVGSRVFYCFGGLACLSGVVPFMIL